MGSKQKLRSLFKLLISGSSTGRQWNGNGMGKMGRGKWKKQPTNRTFRPPGPKIYSEKYILQFSSDFGPRGAALATLACWQGRGTRSGKGRHFKRQSQEGSAAEGVAYKQSTRQDFDKINFID